MEGTSAEGTSLNGILVNGASTDGVLIEGASRDCRRDGLWLRFQPSRQKV